MRHFCLILLAILAGPALAQVATNRAPTASDLTVAMSANTILTNPAPGLLTGATDPDSDPLTVVLSSITSSLVTVQSDGAFVFQPAAGFVGTNCFDFTITDGIETSAVGTACVIVDGPTAHNDNGSVVLEGDLLSVAAPGVLANDTGSRTNARTAFLFSPPAHGTATVNPDGAFTYQPAGNFNSRDGFFTFPDSFRYQVTDGLATSLPATVFITVEPAAQDADLYVRWLSFKQLRTAINRDRLALRGRINPRGARRNLTGATLAIEIGGQPFGIPVVLGASGTGASISSNGIVVRAHFDSVTGDYSAVIRGLDLGVLSIADNTGLGITELKLALTITGADLERPVINGTINPRYATLAGKYTRGLFESPLHETPTGVFASLKTTATEINGQFQLSFAGVIEPQDSTTNAPNDDIQITIGSYAIVVGSNLVAGLPEFAYAKNRILDLNGFSINTKQRTFTLSTTPIPDTGIPSAGATNLVHALPLLIEIPTSRGLTSFKTTIELKRANTQSTKWAR